MRSIRRQLLRAAYGFYFDTPNLNPFLDNRPGNAAPNGVEGNPGGPNPVYTVAPTGGAKTTIVKNVPIFPTHAELSLQCNVNLRRLLHQSQLPLGLQPELQPERRTHTLTKRHRSGRLRRQPGTSSSQPLDINQLNIDAHATARPYASTYPQYSNINEVESVGTSNYNALQTQIRLQSWHRLSGSVVYTWSHNLDEVTAYRGALPQDSFNFKGDYGNTDFDTRNTFVGFLSYAIPSSSHARLLTNGWQVNSLLSFHGGQPFTVHASGDISGTNEGNDRAVQIGAVRKGYQGQKPDANWIDPAAFADPATGTFGSSRRNGYYGPGYSDVDLSFFKDTKIKEFVTLQFRAEMFNLFNRVNYAPPGGGGVSVGGNFTLNDTIGDYNGAPGIGAGEPFNTQFAVKIIF